MKATFRQVFVYNLDIGTTKAGAKLPTMAEIVQVWDQRRAAGQAHFTVQQGDIDIVLGDVHIDPVGNTAVLLIRHSDKHSAESVYSNPRAGAFRAHAKGAGEGGETGGHVFISLTPERQVPNRYTCLIEKVPYLDVRLIRRFLNRLLRDEYDTNNNAFSYPNPAGARSRAGTVRVDRCLPRLEFGGRPSKSLARDVQNGRLMGIKLTRAVTHTPVGGVPYITKREASLSLGSGPIKVLAGAASR